MASDFIGRLVAGAIIKIFSVLINDIGAEPVECMNGDLYALGPIIAARRSRMALAPLSVNVRSKIFSGAVSVFCKMFAARMLKSSVLPVPGPAMTNSGRQ